MDPAIRAAGRPWRQRRLLPQTLIFFVTSRCNARCDFCLYWAQINDPVPRSAELRVDEVERIADRYGHLEHLALSGGEPFVRRDLHELCQAFIDRCGTTMIDIPSNFWFTEAMVASMGELARRNPGVRIELQLSLDHIGDAHDESRHVAGLYERARHTVHELTPIRRSHPNLLVKASTVWLERNQDDLPEITDAIRRDFALDRLHVAYPNTLVPPEGDPSVAADVARFAAAARRLERPEAIGLDPYGIGVQASRRLQHRMLEAAADGSRPMGDVCEAGRFVAVIDERGEVYPCEPLWSSVGNLRDHDYDLHAVLAQPAYAQFRAMHLGGGRCSCTWGCAAATSLASRARHRPALAAGAVAVALRASRGGRPSGGLADDTAQAGSARHPVGGPAPPATVDRRPDSRTGGPPTLTAVAAPALRASAPIRSDDATVADVGGPTLAVIIPCTRPDAATDCLASLADQPEAGRVEVAVVGDVDGIDVPPGLRVELISSADRHPNRRRQAGVERTGAPLLAFLDDDTTVEPGWLATALRVDPRGREVITGPEAALQDHPTSRLLEQVCSSVLSEGSLTHRHEQARTVGWTSVPLSNAVVPRRVLDNAGGLGVDVIADIDDLELFRRCRHLATFRNDPALRIKHDRYPPSVRQLLAYRWRVRRRVGEKLVTHPDLYGAIPQAVAVAAAPWLGAAAVSALGPRRSLRLGGAMYGALLTAQAAIGLRRVGAARVPAFVGTTVALHAANVAAVQVGLWRALLGGAATGDYEGRTGSPREGETTDPPEEDAGARPSGCP